VGTQKKHYSLQTPLLYYYSDYFKACFNGKFSQGQIQKLTSEKDKVEHFEILLEYMISGGVILKDSLNIKEIGKGGLKKCMEFIEYTDKYGMGDASSAVHDTFQKILHTTKTYYAGTSIQPSHVETVFRVAAPGNPLRSLIAKAALPTTGMAGADFSKQ
jgi:hypothetical protein